MVALYSLLASLCPTALAGSAADWIAVGESGMVASDSAEASQAGLEILKAGGNAIDAATAVSFALGVTRPYSTGVGGGGFMIARFVDGKVVCWDYREIAPAGASEDMYLRQKQPDASRNGHLAVAVPGMVAGRWQALNQYGTMPLQRVLQPAVRLARDGYTIDRHYVDSSRDALERYEKDCSLIESCSYVYGVHLNNGWPYHVGDRLKQPQLADFLKRLAKNGPQFFYEGPVAQAMEREMVKHGGLIRMQDLSSYRVVERRPVISTYRDYTIITMPPSSGGVALVQTLNTLEQIDLKSLHERDRHLACHYLVEAMKHAFADRARWLGDSDFAAVPLEYLTSKTYGRKLFSKIRPDRILDLAEYGSKQLPEDSGTSHFCVADRWGNLVVSTETINTSFGSLAALSDWGIILNNEMDDFAVQPGKPNVYELIQSKRNAVGPGKRPLSSMCPTIVLKDGDPYLLIGASGGPRIISSVLNVMIDLLDYEMTLDQAFLAPRVHHQWQPDEVFFDQVPSADLAEALISRGHRLSKHPRSSVVQAILRTKDGWLGASDPSKGGRPAGY